MLVSSVALVASLASLVAASPSLVSRNKGSNTNSFVPTNYTVVDGFFKQTSPSFNATGFDVLNSNLGLLDASKDGWKKFARAIKKLNDDADDLTAYKVVYVARHGEGYHNLAESTYGKAQWDCRWSLINGDGNITWGPDPLLTPKGIQQAEANNVAWKAADKLGAPLPQKLYSSPMRRSASTLEITWSDILLNKGNKYTPIIKERYRESIGLHTCDQRSDRSVIELTYPGWQFGDNSFTEQDQLWNPTWQESSSAQALRLQQEVNELFSMTEETYVSITAHSGAIRSFFTAVGHPIFSVQTGGVVPVVIKAVGHRSASNKLIAASPSVTAPTCAA